MMGKRTKRRTTRPDLRTISLCDIYDQQIWNVLRKYNDMSKLVRWFLRGYATRVIPKAQQIQALKDVKIGMVQEFEEKIERLFAERRKHVERIDHTISLLEKEK